ncbi:hypothetical protein F66182_7164 [Fusarium sp. NRRL 66182]|nr:hypothetical protein F66182_7164 [Fusarium sp. NRRL 66182]
MAPSASICTTPSCIHIASDILGSMALNYTDIDPCQDFTQYACGNWASQNDIPPGSGYVVSLTLAEQHAYSAARGILESPYPAGGDAGYITVNLTKEQTKADKENLAKIQDAYQACTNYDALEKEGLDGLSAFAKSIVDMFPATSASNRTRVDPTALGNVLAYFEGFGIATLQQFLVVKKPYNPDELQLVLAPPQADSVPLSSNGENAQKIASIASQLLAAVYPSKINTAAVPALVDSLSEFQTRLLEADAWSSDNESNDPVPADNLQKLAPSLNYEYVLKELAPQNWTDSVNVVYPTYFRNVSRIVSETSPSTLQAYFLWKAISSLSPYVEHDLTNAYNALTQKMTGRDPESPVPRWKRCVTLVDRGVDWILDSPVSESIGTHGLTWILSRFFVDTHFGPEAKKLTSEIVDYLMDSFSGRVKTREWATKEVKDAAVEKIEAMQRLVGLPTDPNAVDPIAIKEYYSDIKISPSNAINALSFAKSKVTKTWQSLARPFSRGQFIMSPLTANAYHNPSSNQMVLLPGFLQAPNYDVGFPPYILFGGMGSVVGHEITHGFDSKGYQFDKTGNKTSWWDQESLEAFHNKTECFIDQYSKFTVTAPNGTELHVDGELTLGENIADAGGVVSSFAAWKKWESDKGKAQSLPGLSKFTHEQLFFLKWGQTWCANVMPQASVGLLKDVHSPPSARSQLPLKNSAGFNKAFDCPKKEPVCELW